MGQVKKAVYGIYKGDEFVDVGTVDQMAKKFNVKESTIHWWASPCNAERNVDADKEKGGRMIAVKLGKIVYEVSEGGEKNEKETHYNAW